MSRIIWTPPGGEDAPAPSGNPAPKAAPASGPPGRENPHGPPVEVQHHPTPQELHDELAQARAHAADLANQLKYLTADMENFRRRKAKELEEARLSARVGVVSAFLQVLDAIEASMTFKDQDPAKVAQGVQMIHHQTRSVLQGQDVVVLSPPAGEPLNPQEHEGVDTEPWAEGKTAGAVAGVVSVGYRLGERVLRPARVVVVAAPPQAQQQDSPLPVEETPQEPAGE